MHRSNRALRCRQCAALVMLAGVSAALASCVRSTNERSGEHPTHAIAVSGPRSGTVALGQPVELTFTWAGQAPPSDGLSFYVKAPQARWIQDPFEAPRSQLELTWSGRNASSAAQMLVNDGEVGAVLQLEAVDTDGDPIALVGRTSYVLAAGLADSTVTIDQELIWLAGGLKASIYWDFSNEHEFRADDFEDSSEGKTYRSSNAPGRMVLLSSPYEDGLAVSAGRQILELRHPDKLVVHDYTPAAANKGGPDGISAIVRNELHDGLVLCSSSAALGDGIYRVNAHWQISRLNEQNNCVALAGDPHGRFDARLTPALYYGVSSRAALQGLNRYPDVPVHEVEPADMVLLASGDLVMRRKGRSELGVVRSGSHEYEVLTTEYGGTFVTGALDLDGAIFHVLEQNRLLAYESDSGLSIVAASRTAGWRWVAAVKPPKHHILAGGQTVFYLLESNRVLDIDRILRLSPGP